MRKVTYNILIINYQFSPNLSSRYSYTKPVVKDNIQDLFSKNPEVDLKAHKFDSTIIINLDGKLKINIAQMNSVMEGNGIVQPDTESSGGEISGEGSGSGEETTEEKGSGEAPTTTSTTSSTTTEADDTEGSGSGYTEPTKKTTSPVVRTSTTRAPTKPACHPNDYNCQPTDPSEPLQSNGVDSIDVNWHQDTQQMQRQSQKASSASTLSMNLFAVAVSALLAFMLL